MFNRKILKKISEDLENQKKINWLLKDQLQEVCQSLRAVKKELKIEEIIKPVSKENC
jgi:hypothetical protein